MKGMRKKLSILAAAVILTGLALIGATPYVLDRINPPVVRAGVPVLIYHHFAPPGLPKVLYNDNVLDPALFERQIKYMKDNRYNIISLAELYEAMSQNRDLPPKTLVITIDDGYESNYIYAYPILKKYNVKATVNLVVSYMRDGQAGQFDPEVSSWMTWSEIKEMHESGLVDFQSHTYDLHKYVPQDNQQVPAPLLRLKNPQTGQTEANEEYHKRILADFSKSKNELEQRLAGPVFCISYPFGAYDKEIETIAKEAGYTMMLTVKNGANRAGDPVTEIKRVNVTPQDRWGTLYYRAREIYHLLKGRRDLKII